MFFRSAYGANTGVAPDGSNIAFMYAGRVLQIPAPTGYSGVDYLGILVERYQPTVIDSNVASQYTNVVQINGKKQWFIPKSQLNGDKYELKFNHQPTRQALFSAFYDNTSTVGSPFTHNLTVNNTKFKLVIHHIFRLPEGRDIQLGPDKVIYFQLAPAILNVTSATKGTLVGNEVLDIQVQFSQSVKVTGTPRILLNNNTYAYYVSGSGSADGILTFRYTVPTKDASVLKLDTVGSIDLNGGTIKANNAGAVDAVLNIPLERSLAKNTEIVIDQTNPNNTVLLNANNYTNGTNVNNINSWTNQRIQPQIRVSDTYSGVKNVSGTFKLDSSPGTTLGTYSKAFTASVTRSGAAQYDVFGLSRTSDLTLNSINVPSDYEGTATLSIVVHDATGKFTTNTWKYKIDTLKPRITIKETYATSAVINVQDASGIAEIKYRFTNTTLTPTLSETVPSSELGPNATNKDFEVFRNPSERYLHISIKDTLGNTLTGYFYVNTPPEITSFTVLNHKTWYNKMDADSGVGVEVKVTGNDIDKENISIKYKINGTERGTLGTVTADPDFTVTKTLPLSEFNEGTNTLSIYAVDPLSAKSKEESVTIRKDTVPPTQPTMDMNENWTNINATFTLSGGNDTTSGLQGYQYSIDGGGWINYSGVTTARSISGISTVKVRSVDVAGNTSSEVSKTARVDKEEPTFTFQITKLTQKELGFEIKNAQDQPALSGLNSAPYRFEVTGPSLNVIRDWSTSNSYSINTLLPNRTYTVSAKVRDNAGNIKTVVETPTTLTAPIKVTHTFNEETGQVDITIDLGDNPPNTKIVLNRQNMTNSQTLNLKTWASAGSKILKFTDWPPLQNLIEGCRYTVYAVNLDDVPGEPVSLEVQKAEEPEVTIKGVGNDKYMYDQSNKELYLFGKTSGYLEFNIKTQATKKLIYKVKRGTPPPAGGTDNRTVVGEGTLYGRLEEYVYSARVPVSPFDKETYEIELYTEFNVNGTKTPYRLDGSHVFTVWHVSSLRKIMDFTVDEVDDESKVSYNLTGIGLRPFIQNKFSNLDILVKEKTQTNPWQTINKASGIATVPNNLLLTVAKATDSGVYEETFRADNVTISTNISSFITNLDTEWSLEITVTSSKGRYVLPRDSAKFTDDGYTLKAIIAPNFTPIGDTNGAKFRSIEATGNTVYNADTLVNQKLTEPTVAAVGIAVKDVLTTYKIQNLNLQNRGSTATLNAIGNDNIQYDKSYIYNHINNVMKPHGETTYSEGNWVATLYYRPNMSGSRLILVTREKTKVFRTDLEEVVGSGEVINNTGSALYNNVLYLGTSDGLKTVDLSGKTSPTTFTKSVNAIATDGFRLFVATHEGLHILDSNLNEVQKFTPTELGLSTIQSLHCSDGRIYVGEDYEAHTYVVLGKGK